MSADEIYDLLHQTDHVVLSKIVNGGTAFLNDSERLVYDSIVRHAEELGWSHERIMWALQRVMDQ